MVRIWEQKLMKEDSNWIPVIIPMIIYHGKETWKIKDSLGEMIHDYDSLPEEVKQLTPDFRYLLYDLSKFSDEDIKVGSWDYIVLSILKDINLKKDQDFLETII